MGRQIFQLLDKLLIPFSSLFGAFFQYQWQVGLLQGWKEPRELLAHQANDLYPGWKWRNLACPALDPHEARASRCRWEQGHWGHLLASHEEHWLRCWSSPLQLQQGWRGLGQVWETPLVRLWEGAHPGPALLLLSSMMPSTWAYLLHCCTATSVRFPTNLAIWFLRLNLDAGSRNLCSAQSSAGWALQSPPLCASVNSQRSVSVSDVHREERTGGKLGGHGKGMQLEGTCRRPGADGIPQAVVLLGHEVLLPGGQQLMTADGVTTGSAESWSTCTEHTVERISALRRGHLGLLSGCMIGSIVPAVQARGTPVAEL